MDATEIQRAWEEACSKRINVAFTTYRGKEHETRPDKAMHLLSQMGGDLNVLVGDRGTRGPATLKSGNGTKAKNAFKSNAFFALTNAGFERAKIETVSGVFDQGFDLWEACFREHHSRSLEAKKLFIQLCGGEAPSAFEAASAAASKVEVKRSVEKAKPGYEGNPLFGLI